MDVSSAEAKNRLTKLVRAVEQNDSVMTTRNGTPVAEILPAPAGGRKVRFGSMRDAIRLHPGWDEPVDVGRFLEGAFERLSPKLRGPFAQ